jgi:hypothetical protein
MIYTGVLILNGNRTYSPPNNTTTTTTKYYKCIPRNNTILQTILIPYKFHFAKGDMFNKVQDNIYIIYEYNEATITTTNTNIIIATLKEVIGPTKSYEAFQKYELCSRNIYNSLSLHNKYINSRLLSNKNELEIQYFYNKYNITPFTDQHNNIITIDPKGAQDLDDAISIIDNVILNTIEISVYISLVSGWVDYYDNWQYLCDTTNIRVSTIYLPNGEIRPIFPTVLSHNKMSLLADNKLRPVLTTTFIYDKNTKKLIHYIIKPDMIYINKNYIYDTPDLMDDKTYKTLIDFTTEANGDSHKLIEYWMIQTGLICGKEIKRRKLCSGIYRECLDITDTTTNLELGWKSYKSKYILDVSVNEIYHNGIGENNYVHITSPIRRLVDIWNQSLLLNGTPNELLYEFVFEKGGIDIINNKMREIQKTQNSCALLYKLIHSNNTPIICDGLPFYDGNKWKIYLPKYKLWSTLYIPPNKKYNGEYLTVKCSIVFFECEHNIRKKIKIMAV